MAKLLDLRHHKSFPVPYTIQEGSTTVLSRLRGLRVGPPSLTGPGHPLVSGTNKVCVPLTLGPRKTRTGQRVDQPDSGRDTSPTGGDEDEVVHETRTFYPPPCIGGESQTGTDRDGREGSVGPRTSTWPETHEMSGMPEDPDVRGRNLGRDSSRNWTGWTLSE